MKWYMKYGKYWALHYQFDYWLSFGVHIDIKRRLMPLTGEKYGPYIDFHFFCFILSLGFNPIKSTAYHASIFRAGEACD